MGLQCTATRRSSRAFVVRTRPSYTRNSYVSNLPREPRRGARLYKSSTDPKPGRFKSHHARIGLPSDPLPPHLCGGRLERGGPRFQDHSKRGGWASDPCSFQLRVGKFVALFRSWFCGACCLAIGLGVGLLAWLGCVWTSPPSLPSLSLSLSLSLNIYTIHIYIYIYVCI